MGTAHSVRKDSFDVNSDVNFDHFQILRAIGKGSFGKVCIVQKKDTKKMYAMKYMNKDVCIQKDAVRNVFREVEILSNLEHPFLVNLWFTFQDQEDMFMVVDLLLGGDLRYHLQQVGKIEHEQVKLYVAEIALALDYLASKYIIHRDIKPDNVLLDEAGHAHITDFNIATMLPRGQVAVSISGTKPYMAPEVYQCAFADANGYSYAVDWWSLGVCAYEMLRGRRPFDICNSTTAVEAQAIFSSSLHFPSSWDSSTQSLIRQLLSVDPHKRLADLLAIQQHSYMQNINFGDVLSLSVQPSFVPSKDQLNCDPTYELEEMIIETKPLHKKKKRLAKKNSKREHSLSSASTSHPMQDLMDDLEKKFRLFNREKEQHIDVYATENNHSQKKKISDTMVASPDLLLQTDKCDDR